MKTAQYLKLAESDRDGFLFDLKAKALVSGNKRLLARLEKINGEGDTADLLGELQSMGALPDLEPDDGPDPREDLTALDFPMQAFPDWFAEMVRDTAGCCQVTDSHAAQDARLALNALIGPSLRYEITEDWSRQCGLFLCIVGDTGTGKSRTSRQLMRPMYDLQRDIIKKAERGLINASVEAKAREAEREQLEKQLKDLFKPGKRRPSGHGMDADAIKERIAELEAEAKATAPDMIEPTLWETDVTTEYLLRVMIENGGMISLIGMETPLFGILAGRYTQGVIEAVEVFNDAFDGMPVSAGRMKSKKVICDEPCLAVSVGTQPAVLFKTGASSTLLERGTLARFSFYEPQSLLGSRDMKLKTIDPNVHETYLQKMREIGETYRATPPQEGEPVERLAPTSFKFSKNAVERFEKWRQLREAERQQGGRLRRLTGFQARIDDMLPRTAVQLHALWNGPSAPPYVSEETVELAILVTEFDIQATDRVFSKMGLDTVARLADAIEDWAAGEKVTETTVQKLSRVSLGMEKTADEVRAACVILQQEGFLTLTKVTKKKGGRPSELIVFDHPF